MTTPSTRKKKTWKTWTSKEEDRLEEMRLSQMTVRQCAVQLNRSHQSVRMQCQRMGLSRVRCYWHVLLLEEHNIREVAETAGVAYSTVKREKARMRRRGWKCPPSTKKEKVR